MPEVLNVPIFLETLRSNDKYREEFTAVAGDIKADIVSFQSNPKCGCRRKIYDFVEANKETDSLKNFFRTWKPQIPNLFIEATPNGAAVTSTPTGNVTVEAQKTAPATPPNATAAPVKVMMGHVVEIPASPDEYKKLIDHARDDRWVYRGLSVITKDDKWLVFFY